MAVDWVAPVLTCGAMFFAERQLRVLLTPMSYTSHMVSNLVHMGAIFITSWSYLVLHLALSRTFWNFNSAGKHLFFYILPHHHLWYPRDNILGNVKVPDIFFSLPHFKTDLSSSKP